MPSRRKRKSKTLAAQVSDLAVAVPQVVAERVARMSRAGPSPSSRDRREFYLMGAEKVAAFYESWNAMLVETFRANQQLSLSMLRSFRFPWAGLSISPTSAQVQRAAIGIVGSAIAPVRRRAVSNAKRLRRTKRR